ncbi:MAG: hypothetical protein HQL54_03475 [Magnetococcales bacterium]|nr:hypothetical protein [Magnetococcales bacterium]
MGKKLTAKEAKELAELEAQHGADMYNSAVVAVSGMVFGNTGDTADDDAILKRYKSNLSEKSDGFGMLDG